MTAVLLDDWCPRALLSAVDAAWPSPTSGLWHCYIDSGKLATKTPHGLPRVAQIVLDRMATLPIGELCGLDGAFADLDQLHGAGLHQLCAGQELGLHLDAERHPLMPWRREASAVLYLDDVAEGGRLELCDADGNVVESVESRRGRLVLFRTPGQWHRVTECGSLRRSLCLFFWRLDDDTRGNSSANFA